jgi:hypothetical protein
MAVTLNASTSAGLIQSADTSGEIELQSNGTTALKVNTNEGIQILNCLGVGNATPSTSGAGITFPATQSASTDANTLDDYEEGTWTPTLTTAGGSAPTGIGYAYRSGRYTKIGNRVIASFGFKLNAISSVGSGEITVTGLPFTSFNYGSWQQDSFAIKAAYFVNASVIGDGLIGWVNDAGTQVYFRTGNNDNSVAASEIQSTTAIGAVIVYQVA